MLVSYLYLFLTLSSVFLRLLSYSICMFACLPISLHPMQLPSFALRGRKCMRLTWMKAHFYFRMCYSFSEHRHQHDYSNHSSTMLTRETQTIIIIVECVIIVCFSWDIFTGRRFRHGLVLQRMPSVAVRIYQYLWLLRGVGARIALGLCTLRRSFLCDIYYAIFRHILVH